MYHFLMKKVGWIDPSKLAIANDDVKDSSKVNTEEELTFRWDDKLRSWLDINGTKAAVSGGSKLHTSSNAYKKKHRDRSARYLWQSRYGVYVQFDDGTYDWVKFKYLAAGSPDRFVRRSGGPDVHFDIDSYDWRRSDGSFYFPKKGDRVRIRSDAVFPNNYRGEDGVIVSNVADHFTVQMNDGVEFTINNYELDVYSDEVNDTDSRRSKRYYVDEDGVTRNINSDREQVGRL